MNWALGFFFIAALIGLTMRAFPLWNIPYFDYRNLLHTHSHIALLGWGFLMVSGGIVFTLAKSAAAKITALPSILNISKRFAKAANTSWIEFPDSLY